MSGEKVAGTSVPATLVTLVTLVPHCAVDAVISVIALLASLATKPSSVLFTKSRLVFV